MSCVWALRFRWCYFRPRVGIWTIGSLYLWLSLWDWLPEVAGIEDWITDLFYNFSHSRGPTTHIIDLLHNPVLRVYLLSMMRPTLVIIARINMSRLTVFELSKLCNCCRWFGRRLVYDFFGSRVNSSDFVSMTIEYRWGKGRSIPDRMSSLKVLISEDMGMNKCRGNSLPYHLTLASSQRLNRLSHDCYS